MSLSQDADSLTFEPAGGARPPQAPLVVPAARPGARWASGMAAAAAAMAASCTLLFIIDASRGNPPVGLAMGALAGGVILLTYALSLGGVNLAARRFVFGRPIVSALLSTLPVAALMTPLLVDADKPMSVVNQLGLWLPGVLAGGAVMGRRIG